MITFICFSVIYRISLSLAADAQQDPPVDKNTIGAIFLKGVKQQHYGNYNNESYFVDTSDGVYRIPELDTNLLHERSRRHPNKNYPKRTIQKIIKKARKSKKTSKEMTSVATTEISFEEIKEEEAEITTQAAPKKKLKKWKGKMNRYPMPFQKLQPFRRETLASHRRIQRDIDEDGDGDGRNLYILQDLDEMKFINKADGNLAIKAHVKNYW